MLDSSSRDCPCCKSYLEATAAGQLTAWLYLGNDLQNQKVSTAFCFPDGRTVGRTLTDILQSVFFVLVQKTEKFNFFFFRNNNYYYSNLYSVIILY